MVEHRVVFSAGKSGRRFLAYASDGHFHGFHCREQHWWAIGIGQKHVFRSKAESEATLEDWAKDWVADMGNGGVSVEHAPVFPGTFHQRVWRPSVPGWGPVDELSPSPQVATQSAVAVTLLLEKLKQLFLTVEPTNATAFGHRIRELLLLACMEVESSWAGVLREHGVHGRLTTVDYVKLCEPMNLSAYEARLGSYPEFPAFKPFDGWDIACPTKSLEWYEAYNKTKHNREANFSTATLANAIHAVGAAVVMAYAQFGPPNVDRLQPLWDRNDRCVVVDCETAWPGPCYVPLMEAVDGRFRPAAWRATNLFSLQPVT